MSISTSINKKNKFEGPKEALNNVKKGNYMIKFYLKSGYHHLEINITCQKYLYFAWRVDGIKKYFVFTVLPFGLSSAPYLFTKLRRTIVRYWRSLANSIIVYLDDGWCCLDLENV